MQSFSIKSFVICVYISIYFCSYLFNNFIKETHFFHSTHILCTVDQPNGFCFTVSGPFPESLWPASHFIGFKSLWKKRARVELNLVVLLKGTGQVNNF